MSEAVLAGRKLPVGAYDHEGVGWWGTLCLIATEAALFCYLLFSYLYAQVKLDGNFLPELPSFQYSLPAVLVLIASSVAIAWGVAGIRRNARGRLLLGLVVALLCGVAFVVLQFLEWSSKPFSLRSHIYGSLFFTITGIHMAHLLVGLLALLLLLGWSALGYFDGRRNAPVLNVAAYWHFVVAAEVAVFFILYVTPYL